VKVTSDSTCAGPYKINMKNKPISTRQRQSGATMIEILILMILTIEVL
jgi:hypothetical protein